MATCDSFKLTATKDVKALVALAKKKAAERKFTWQSGPSGDWVSAKITGILVLEKEIFGHKVALPPVSATAEYTIQGQVITVKVAEIPSAGLCPFVRPVAERELKALEKELEAQ